MMRTPVRFLIAAMCGLLAGIGSAHAIPTSTYVAPDPTKRCYAQAQTPQQLETVSDRVMIRPAATRKRHIPAVYESFRLRVMVKDPRIDFHVDPPRYTTVFEQVLVEPERTVEVKIPAQYETWTETVIVEPAKTVWKRGEGLYGQKRSQSVAGITDTTGRVSGEILCKVKIPAKKRSVRHSRMVSPERTETKLIPARYKTVAKQVLKRPAFARRAPVSAQYAALPMQRELHAASRVTEHVPALYQDVTRTIVRQESHLKQVEVVCDQHASRSTVSALQSALVDRGYLIKIDGIYGPETQGAMERFQHDEGLLRGYMTVESFVALGVPIEPCAARGCPGAAPQTTIAAAQSALTQAGFPAAVDGLHGPQTQAALEQFQQTNGLSVGYLSAETMTALNIIARI